MNEHWDWNKKIKVRESCDICVIGGSCTGVFAAVRAARLGAKVVLIEKANRLGGVATLGLVGMWHSLFDTAQERRIIGGLTFEMLERLEKQDAVSAFRHPGHPGIRMNTEELAIELDMLVSETPGIKLRLQTSYIDVVADEKGDLKGAIIADKSGIFAIAAGCFIDASGDGVLCRDAGVAMRRAEVPQPPTSCCRLENWEKIGDIDLKKLIKKNRPSFPDLPCGYAWGMPVPGSSSYMLAATRILNCDCSEADAVTGAEVSSRRQIRALVDMLKKEFPQAGLSLQALPSALGIREGWHIDSLSRLKGRKMLAAAKQDDAIGNGTYPVDIHSSTDDGIEFYRLSGDHCFYRSNQLVKQERWLPEGEILPYYQIPLRALIPSAVGNLIAAGRMIDADAMAFGAVRVMVNLNQCGEAAGVAAYLAMSSGRAMQTIIPEEVRCLLAAGGSIIL